MIRGVESVCAVSREEFDHDRDDSIMQQFAVHWSHLRIVFRTEALYETETRKHRFGACSWSLIQYVRELFCDIASHDWVIVKSETAPV
jgi:hypothetical protein